MNLLICIVLDIDECVAQTAQCDVDHATCENLPGTFTCTCDVGYTGDGFTCTGKILFSSPTFVHIDRSICLVYLGGGVKGTGIVLRIFHLICK